MRALGVLGLGGMALGCAPDEPPSCDGGGTLSVELGDGGRQAFVPFSDGDDLPLNGDRLSVDLWTSGLDTTAPVTASVRVDAGGASEDSLAALTLVCSDDGHGWAGVLAALPVGAGAGTTVTVRAALTDAAGETAVGELTGILR